MMGVTPAATPANPDLFFHLSLAPGPCSLWDGHRHIVPQVENCMRKEV